MLSTLSFLAQHPLTRRNPAAAIARFAAWQIGSRLVAEHHHRWIDGSKLVVCNGMTGATGNIYCGLHEFADMAFLLHTLRPEDLFLDVGANIGSYTVLASAVCGARTIAFEPDPGTAVHFKRNVEANEIGGRVVLHETALGRDQGTLQFTVGLDTVNYVASAADGAVATRTVPVQKLDAIQGAKQAVMIKLDVEGYEKEVLAGGTETLASPSILAVETEAQDAEVTQAIQAAGFVRRWYNPFSRELSKSPLTDMPASNALFIRREDQVLARINCAPLRKIVGHFV